MDGQRRLVQHKESTMRAVKIQEGPSESQRTKRGDVTIWRYPTISVVERIEDLPPIILEDRRDQEATALLNDEERDMLLGRAEEDALGVIENRPVLS